VPSGCPFEFRKLCTLLAEADFEIWGFMEHRRFR
jgi:hypothetical protein